MGEAFKLIEQGCVSLIGPASSGPTTEISTLMSKIPPIDRTIIGYSATSPKLSEPSFSNFLRTPPADDVQAELDALAADVDVWSRDDLVDLALRLVAEGAGKSARVAVLAHELLDQPMTRI